MNRERHQTRLQVPSMAGGNLHNEGMISVFNVTPQDLEWLSPRASREIHQDLREARVDGVGDWLLGTEVFSTWRTLEDLPVNPVLFCYGDPGVGKTFISSLVIDTLCDAIGGNNVAVTYVYCDHSSQNPQSTSSVFGSVLNQVVGAMSGIPEGVVGALARAEREVDACRLRLAEILKLLINFLQRLRRCFICMDALDEFPTKLRAQLWESLRRVVRECPNTRLFLTGRPQIRGEVGKYFSSDADTVSINPPSGDITRYIEHRLEEDPFPDRVGEELRPDILRIVPQMFSGVFLLVALKMDSILGEVTIHKRRQALGKMTYGLDLSKAYGKTLDRIRQQGGSKGKLGIEALMWVSRCGRPLNSEELCYALGVELGQEDFHTQNVPSIWIALGCTLGLLTIDETTSMVHLLHPALHEYLGEHPTLFATAHSMMAEICLTYLTCRSVRAPSLNKALAATPFLEYATCFWGTHAAVKVTEPLKSLALRLLDGYENHVSASVLWQKKIHKPGLAGHVRGISGLHCIAFWGIAEIAASMLEAKRWDVDCRDSEGDTPLGWAVKYGNSKLVKLLLGQGDAEPDVVRDSHAMLSFAAQRGNEDAVKQLLARGDVNPNSSDSNGRTPLSYATMGRQESVVKLLRERGDVNSHSPGSSGQLPQPLAVERRHQHTPDLSEYGNPDRRSETVGRRTTTVPVENAPERAVVDPLPAPGGVAPNTTNDLPPDGSIPHPTPSGHSQKQPLRREQSPPNQSGSVSALSIPILILCFSLGFALFSLLALILFLIFHWYRDPRSLAPLIPGAQQ